MGINATAWETAPQSLLYVQVLQNSSCLLPASLHPYLLIPHTRRLSLYLYCSLHMVPPALSCYHLRTCFETQLDALLLLSKSLDFPDVSMLTGGTSTSSPSQNLPMLSFPGELLHRRTLTYLMHIAQLFGVTYLRHRHCHRLPTCPSVSVCSSPRPSVSERLSLAPRLS